MNIVKCPHCGKDFEKSHGNKKWCSDRCRRRGHSRCADCGGPAADRATRCMACHKKLEARQQAVTRERLLDSIRDWQARYGAAPGAQDWNRAQMRARASQKRLEENNRRHAERRWPTTTTIQLVFGSWSAALKEAGIEPRKVGRPKGS